MLREASRELGGASFVLRSTTTDDLKAFLEGPQAVETTWLSPERQHEEAWVLGLRLNAGVNVLALRGGFGPEMVARARGNAKEVAETGLLTFDGEAGRLASAGRL